jgi:hypothetical protein
LSPQGQQSGGEIDAITIECSGFENVEPDPEAAILINKMIVVPVDDYRPMVRGGENECELARRM